MWRAERVSYYTALLFTALALALPLVWIGSLSLQVDPPFRFVPHHFAAANYRHAIAEDAHGLRSALLYSVVSAGVSTFVALIVSLCALYLVIAERASIYARRHIVQIAIGLYFLPSFAIVPGVTYLTTVSRLDVGVDLQLILLNATQAFSVSFILLLLTFLSTARARFEQLLPLLGSRVVAYWRGVVSVELGTVFMVAALTFATVLSDFFLAALISTNSPRKPFAVVLATALGQYRTDYPVFAAAAVVSMSLTMLLPLALAAALLAMSRLRVPGKGAIPDV